MTRHQKTPPPNLYSHQMRERMNLVMFLLANHPMCVCLFFKKGEGWFLFVSPNAQRAKIRAKREKAARSQLKKVYRIVFRKVLFENMRFVAALFIRTASSMFHNPVKQDSLAFAFLLQPTKDSASKYRTETARVALSKNLALEKRAQTDKNMLLVYPHVLPQTHALLIFDATNGELVSPPKWQAQSHRVESAPLTPKDSQQKVVKKDSFVTAFLVQKKVFAPKNAHDMAKKTAMIF